MNHLQKFFHVRPAQRDHIPAFRIAVGVALPLLTLMVVGRLDLAIYAAFGAFTGIYAKHESPRSRFLRQSLAGLILTVSVAIGAVLSRYNAGEWIVVGAGTVVSGAGAVLAARYNLKAGRVDLLHLRGGCRGIDPGRSPGMDRHARRVRLGRGLCPVGNGGPSHRRATAPGLRPHGDRAVHATGVAGARAALHRGPRIAGTLGILSIGLVEELSHPYWAMVAAVAPISPPHRKDRFLRGVHRMVGTTGGVVVTAFLLSFPSEPWQLVVWIILFQFLAEVYVGRNYSLALLFITPIALQMTQLGSPSEPGPLLLARTVETVIGALVGLSVVAWGFPDEYRPGLLRRIRRQRGPQGSVGGRRAT